MAEALKEANSCHRIFKVIFKSDQAEVFIIFFKILFIHERHRQRDRERERERERERGYRQREKQAPRREPDVGLNPGAPGSHPGLQALNRCTTRAALNTNI